MKRRPWRMLIAVAVLMDLWSGTNTSVSAQAQSYTFPETGKTVTGRFLQYWDDHGGLAQQGYPISDVMGEVSEVDGKLYTVQYFERAVFEYHPEYSAPNDVLLSLLGALTYNRAYPSGAPGQVPTEEPDFHIFAETGKRVGGVFLKYWNAHGGLAQQGYPISDEFLEISALDGQEYRVQYFERAVFEYHPQFPSPNNVQLSQLGTFHFEAKYGAVSTLPPPPVNVPPAIPVTQPPSWTTTPSDIREMADLIVSKYSQIGNCTLRLEDSYLDESATHYIVLYVDRDAFLCIHNTVLPTESEAWGNSVLLEVNRLWPNEPFDVFLSYAHYTFEPCLECDSECYYMSEISDPDKGWVEVFTFVHVYQDMYGNGDVLNCIL